jgi:BirA family biotin operon repressor/biotin-[acetyl-CoA-carboxylase] ligase
MTLDARILKLLRQSQVHLLPGDLAAQLEETLSATESALERLRAAGFDIENKPGLGCRLLGAPNRIIADDLHARLVDCAVAREIIVFEETSSTNDVAMRLGREGQRSGIAVFAERQTAGRGRFGRRWDSADHAGLWFSLLLRPAWPMAQWTRLTTWAGVAVARAVEEFVRARAELKWPNDVLVQGKKVAGILIESAVDTTGAPFAVTGIGVNVNQAVFPEELAETAGSLRQSAGERIDRPAFAATLLAQLGGLLPTIETDFAAIVAEAKRRSALQGSWIRMHAAQETIEGIAEGLDENGQLLLRTPDGNLRTMSAGEVSSRSPAGKSGSPSSPNRA